MSILEVIIGAGATAVFSVIVNGLYTNFINNRTRLKLKDLQMELRDFAAEGIRCHIEEDNIIPFKKYFGFFNNKDTVKIYFNDKQYTSPIKRPYFSFNCPELVNFQNKIKNRKEISFLIKNIDDLSSEIINLDYSPL